LVDFDEIDDWEPRLFAALRPLLPESFGQKLATAAPEYIEDARDILFELANRDNHRRYADLDSLDNDRGVSWLKTQ
jgi:hypothetical protein